MCLQEFNRVLDSQGEDCADAKLHFEKTDFWKTYMDQLHGQTRQVVAMIYIDATEAC